jgi:hypothetical protein
MRINGLSGLSTGVLRVIEGFRDFVPGDSFDACKQTSAQFTQFAMEQGLDARWINLVGGPDDLEPQGPWAEIDRQHWIHYVTKVPGDVYVDWTASQFGDSESVPSLSLGSGWDREYDVTDALDEYLAGLDEALAEDLWWLGAFDGL